MRSASQSVSQFGQLVRTFGRPGRSQEQVTRSAVKTARKAARGAALAGSVEVVAAAAVDPAEQPVLPPAVDNVPRHTVAPGSGSDQKSRLTLILFQSVEHWFSPSQTSKGHGCVRNQRDSSLPSLHGVLIVKSSRHCRLTSPGAV